MIIYKITNRINNKIYVGQTHGTLEKRFRRHCWNSEYKKNMPICLAIKKYGKENFKITQIDSAVSQQDLDRKEIYWAKYYNSMSPNGYNLRVGRGRGIVNDSTKHKIGIANRGKKRSLETKRRLSESHKGHHLSDVTKLKLSMALRGRLCSPTAARAASKANAKTYLMVSPTGQLCEITNMKKYCRSNNLPYV